MKAFIITIVVASALLLANSAALAKPRTLLVLNKRNTLVLRGVVSSSSVAKLQVEILEMSLRLKPTDTIYLILDTPGGSIQAGVELIDFIHGIPQRVKTVTLFAASMGFQIAQNLDERLILPSGTMMSHRASGQFSGEFPGELTVTLEFWLKEINRLDQIAASRMKMSKKSYQKLIRDEYWARGADAAKDKSADRVILARCDKSFEGTSEVELGSFLGMTFYGTMSNCPLITGVLKVRADAGASPDDNNEEAHNMCSLYVSDRTNFVKRYVTTGKLNYR